MAAQPFVSIYCSCSKQGVICAFPPTSLLESSGLSLLDCEVAEAQSLLCQCCCGGAKLWERVRLRWWHPWLF